MKPAICVSKRLLAVSMATLASAVLACAAVTPPALTISDDLGNSVTIDSASAITYGGSCSAITCPGVALSGSGYLGWTSLTVGTFTMVNVVGETKPYLTSPAIDLGIGSVSNVAAGTLTLSWTDTGFLATGPVVLSNLTSYALGSGSTTYSSYIDKTNTPFGEGAGTLIGTIPAVTANTTASTTVNVTEASQPVSMTAVAAVTLSALSSYSNDFGVTATVASNPVTPPNTTPTITTVSLTKTANVKTVNPFQKVTYTYVVKNTGNVTLTNLNVTDDNATPAYTGDDFTVCTIASLAAGTSQTCTASIYPPVTEGANDSNSYSNWGWSGGGWGFDSNHTHAGGTLICKAKSNGNVEFTYLVDPSIADNTYGTGSSAGWGWWGASSSNLLNAGAEFQILDGQGNKVLDFVADYVSQNSAYPSGYGTCGIKGGGGLIYTGNSQNIVSIDTTITDNLNRGKAFNKCTQNSPSGNPDWQNQCGYKVEISCNAWGSKGFGGVGCPVVKHTSKNSGCGQHQVKPISSTATNTATLIAYYGTTELTPVKATATVTIDASQQGWSQCGRY